MLMLTLAFLKLRAAFQFFLLISRPIKGFPVLPILLPHVALLSVTRDKLSAMYQKAEVFLASVHR